MSNADHALLPPSASSRWSRCTASPHEEAKYPRQDTAASKEGTFAHEVLERWLIGNDLSMEGVPEEMVDHLSGVVGYIRNRCNELGMKVAGIELKVDVGEPLGFLAGTIWGTLDVLMESTDLVEILDLKYGFNPVDPEENEQLILYLGGVLGDRLMFLPNDFPVRLTIAQPRRTDGVKVAHWDTTLGVIKGHLGRLGVAAHECYNNPQFNPGEIQCQWCRARNDCEARRTQNLALVEEKFKPVADNLGIGTRPSPVDLSELMFLVPQLEAWISDIRKEAYARAQTGQLPGWKLVQGRRRRDWSEPEEALTRIQKWRIDGKALGLDVARPRGALSPAQAEKIPGLSARQKKQLEEMISSSFGKPVLAPAADPRPAVTVDVEQLFQSINS